MKKVLLFLLLILSSTVLLGCQKKPKFISSYEQIEITMDNYLEYLEFELDPGFLYNMTEDGKTIYQYVGYYIYISPKQPEGDTGVTIYISDDLVVTYKGDKEPYEECQIQQTSKSGNRLYGLFVYKVGVEEYDFSLPFTTESIMRESFGFIIDVTGHIDIIKSYYE